MNVISVNTTLNTVQTVYAEWCWKVCDSYCINYIHVHLELIQYIPIQITMTVSVTNYTAFIVCVLLYCCSETKKTVPAVPVGGSISAKKVSKFEYQLLSISV